METQKVRIASGLNDWEIKVDFNVDLISRGPFQLTAEEKARLDAIKSRIYAMVAEAISDTLLTIKHVE